MKDRDARLVEAASTIERQASLWRLVLVSLALLISTLSGGSASRAAVDDYTTSEISTGGYPTSVAANPATNKVYVTDCRNWDETAPLWIIDDIKRRLQRPLNFKGCPLVALNAATNRIYVVDSVALHVINGSTNRIMASVDVTADVYEAATSIAVNVTTNQVFVGIGREYNYPTTQLVLVINGSNNVITRRVEVTGDSGGMYPQVVVNPVTNAIYASTNYGLFKISGTTYNVSQFAPHDGFLGIDSTRNRVFVNSHVSQSLVALRGKTGETVAESDGYICCTILANPTANLVYVPVDEGCGAASRYECLAPNNSLSVFDGKTLDFVTSIPVGKNPVWATLLSSRVYVTHEGGVTVVQAASASPAPTPSPLPRTYLAMGDSFSSGDGAPPYDPKSRSPQCRRSESSGYPNLLAKTHSDYFLASVACSGATVDDILTPISPKHYPTEGIGQFYFLSQTTDLVTMTVGGDDVGFADVIMHCVALADSCDDYYRAGGAHDIAAEIDGLKGSLLRLYRRMASRAPNATFYVITYPLLTPGAEEDCDLITGFNNLTPEERQWIRDRGVQLNSVIIDAVAEVGVGDFHYIDSSDAFKGHEICKLVDGSPYVNDGTSQELVQGYTPWHPSPSGYDQWAKCVEQAIDAAKDFVCAAP